MRPEPEDRLGLPDVGARRLSWSDDSTATYEHVHRYLYASRYVDGKRVLDVACGEGQGTRMLAHKARWVIGVDSDATTLAHARQHHGSDNVWFVQAEVPRFHLASNSVDVIVSFETDEALPTQSAFLNAMQACLAPGGLFLLAALVRQVPTGGHPLHNPSQREGFDRAELLALLKSRFANVGFYGQQMVATSMIGRMAGERFPRGGASFAPLPTVVDPEQREYPLAAEAAIAPRYFLVICSDSPLPSMPSTFLLDHRETLWTHFQRLEQRAVTHGNADAAAQAETQRWSEAEAKGAAAQTRIGEMETALADLRSQLWEAEMQTWKLRTELEEAYKALRLAETQTRRVESALQASSTQLQESNVQRQRASLIRSVVSRTPTGMPPHVLVLVPGDMNYFYDQAGRRLAESLSSLGCTVDLHTLRALPAEHPRYDWTLVVNIAEVLIAYGAANAEARQQGRITPEERARALARLVSVREKSDAIGIVQLDAVGTDWFDYALTLSDMAGISTVFDLGFHDQSRHLSPYQQSRYQFLFNGLTESERTRLDAVSRTDDRPVPWVFVGHLTPDRADLVQRLMRDVDPRGFVYMPVLAPFVEGGVHLDEEQFATVLSRARYQVWRSHHPHFYIESERFRHSALAGGVPVKLIAGALPEEPLPFRNFLLDTETFAAELKQWDFRAMRQQFADEFRTMPSLDDSVLTALAAHSRVRLYGP